MGTETAGIRYQSTHREKVQNLMYLVNERTLLEEHRKQSRKKATGIDGVNKTTYDVHAAASIHDLVERMKRFQYRPLPVRRTYIPKANGKLRPLGIPAYEDRLVQGVMAKILSEVYEARFLECSYGFRPGRSCHDVVRLINRTVMNNKVNYVLEADIKGFFDHVNHDWLMKFLEHDIQDKKFLRYVKRFLIAGIMEDGKRTASDRGTPQGGQISPVLANVYLHYVLDLWVEKAVKPKARGEVHYVRYADDFLMLFQYESDARAVMEVLKERLGKFSLEVAEDKTRILPIGRFKGTKENFDFLGFTFYNTQTRGGKYRLGIQTSKKKLKNKRQAAKAWLKKQKNKPIDSTLKTLALVMRGHCNYYGISGNSKDIRSFHLYLITSTYRMLTRRSQKSKLTWEKFGRIWKEYVTPPRICVDIWTPTTV